MLDYDLPLWRPPSEADSLIIQATVGCSFNRCSFCSMYRTKEFRVRPLDDVLADIALAARVEPRTRRVFLADGDALVAPADHLIEILEALAAAFPDLQRVSCYAWPLNVINKTPADLEELRARRLALFYVGIETGAAKLLKRITKGANPEIVAEALSKARAAGQKVSATVILGVGGRRHAREHVEGTIDLVNEAPPNYLSTLQLGVADVVDAEFHRKFGETFEWQDDEGMMEELEWLVAGIDPPRPIIFRSNHASNALPLAGTLPRDRDRLLATLAAARRGDVATRPLWLRGM